MAITATPTSANTAPHMEVIPSAPSSRNRAFTPRANTMFSFTIRRHLRAMSMARAMDIARKCLRIVKENIVFALGVKALFLLLGALGMTSMWGAVFADVGVAVIAILNATRMLKTKASGPS